MMTALVEIVIKLTPNKKAIYFTGKFVHYKDYLFTKWNNIIK